MYSANWPEANSLALRKPPRRPAVLAMSVSWLTLLASSASMQQAGSPAPTNSPSISRLPLRTWAMASSTERTLLA